MTIDEAIKELKKAGRRAESLGEFEQARAIKLGFEALRAIKQGRANTRFFPIKLIRLMPGETEE